MPPRRKADEGHAHVGVAHEVVRTPKHFSQLCEECGQTSPDITDAKGQPVLDADGQPVRHTSFSCAHGTWVFNDEPDPEPEAE